MKLEQFWKVIGEHPWMLAVVLLNRSGGFFDEATGHSIRNEWGRFGLAFTGAGRFEHSMWGRTHYIAFRPPGSFSSKMEAAIYKVGRDESKEGLRPTPYAAIPNKTHTVTGWEVKYLVVCFIQENLSEDVDKWFLVTATSPKTLHEVLSELPPNRDYAVVKITETSHVGMRYLEAGGKEMRMPVSVSGLSGYDVWLFENDPVHNERLGDDED